MTKFNLIQKDFNGNESVYASSDNLEELKDLKETWEAYYNSWNEDLLSISKRSINLPPSFHIIDNETEVEVR